MSLIFKALQRFGNPESKQVKDTKESAPKRNTVTLRKVLLSPPIAFTAAAAIFLMGLVVSQGINFYTARGNAMAPLAAAALPAEAATPDAMDSDPSAMEPLSQTVSDNPSLAQVPGQTSYLVYPPEQKTPLAANVTAKPDKVQFRYLEATDTVAEGGDSRRSEASPPLTSAALDTKENQAGAASSTGTPADSSPNVADDLQTNVLSLVRHNSVPPAVLSKTESNVARPSISAHVDERESADPNPNHQRQAAQATMHLQVSKLANRISSAIQADDVQQTDALLAKLAKMKGADNLFVLKLKAYSFIRQNRLEEAHALLSNVLAHNAMDREAGLNMAVIDIKAGRLENAQRRLVQLQELYPEDGHIALYLRQLPR